MDHAGCKYHGFNEAKVLILTKAKQWSLVYNDNKRNSSALLSFARGPIFVLAHLNSKSQSERLKYN